MPQQIITARLRLRSRKLSDLSDILSLELDQEVARYAQLDFGHKESINDRTKLRKSIKDDLRKGEERNQHIWVIEWKESNSFAGIVCLGFVQKLPSLAIGVRVSSKEWNKGIATESIEAVINYGFDKLELRDVCAAVHIENHASSRVFTKIGFEKAGVLSGLGNPNLAISNADMNNSNQFYANVVEGPRKATASYYVYRKMRRT